MPQKHEFSQLVVQQLPVAGFLVRFRPRKIIAEKTIRQIREELESLVAPERLIVLDLSNVEYLSSAVIGALITIHRQLRRCAGNITLCGMHPQIEEVFRITRLNRKFEIYPDLETALGDEASAP